MLEILGILSPEPRTGSRGHAFHHLARWHRRQGFWHESMVNVSLGRLEIEQFL